MSFVVAGVVLLLAMIAGLLSFRTVPKMVASTDEGSEEKVNQRNTPPATTIVSFFSKDNWKQWLLLTVLSLVCAFAAYRLYEAGSGLINLCDQMAVALVLLSILIIDGYTHLIPNVTVAVLFGIGAVMLAISWIMNGKAALNTLIMSVLGLLICLVLFYVMSRLTKEGIGMGDVKLIAALGWSIGLEAALLTVLFALLICTVAAFILLFGKKKNGKDRVPFGPFMFFGYISMLLLFSL